MSNRITGKRYNNHRDGEKLNLKKVFATIIAIIVIIMIFISLKRLLTNTNNTKDVSTLVTYVAAFENNKWGVIDNKGNTIIDFDYDEMIVIPNKNKDFFICNYDVDYSTETYKTKVLNKNGEQVLNNYNNIKPVENTNGKNIWYEDNMLIYEENGKYGLINFEGEKILEAEYDNIYPLDGIEKSIIIEKDGLKGLVNTSLGEIIIPAKYVDISSLSKTYDDGYIIKNSENKCGIIGADKTNILEEKYDDIKHITGNNYYVVVENGETKVIDASGQIVLNSGFDSVEEINLNNFVIIKDEKYGLISKDGQVLIAPEYDNIKNAFSNYYIVQKEGKYGIIDDSKNVVIESKYDRISYIKEADFFEAETENFKTDIIDRNFNVILENIIVAELNIDGGYVRVRENDDYKYYNFKFEEKTNKEVLATNTLFLVKENGKYGYENKDGQRIVDCKYDDAKEQNEFGYCAVKENGKWGALKSDGTVVLEPSLDMDNYLYIDFIAEWHKMNDSNLNAYTK